MKTGLPLWMQAASAVFAIASSTVAHAYVHVYRASGRHHINRPRSSPKCYLQLNGDDGGGGSSRRGIVDSISYRPALAGDVQRCHEIEAASYPEDEAASLKSLRYRQQNAGDYFWVATLPMVEAAKLNGMDDLLGETGDGDMIIGFICSTRCNEFTEESMTTHEEGGSIIAVHSVVVESQFRRKGIASAMMNNYLKQMVASANGFKRILLLAKSHLLGFYVENGYAVLRPSPIVHGKETWYELEARQDVLEQMKGIRTHPSEGAGPSTASPRVLEASRSTANPDEGDGNAFADGRNRRREKLRAELSKLGIDPDELEAHPERFGTAALRTYNSFLVPKSKGALAVAESPTRPRVVANNISFLAREHKADQEKWLRNVDQNDAKLDEKHPITIVLDNVRSASNVGNILRIAEAAQVSSVRLCGMTPRPPHPKVLKTAMKSAEYVSLGDEGADSSGTLQTVLDLKASGHKIFGVETTENATVFWDTDIIEGGENAEPVAYVFGNELIGVDVQVLRVCDGLICLPTYGVKNSLNVATCVGIVVWEALRKLKRRS